MVQFVYGVAHPFLFGSLELLKRDGLGHIVVYQASSHVVAQFWAMMIVGVEDSLPPPFFGKTKMSDAVPFPRFSARLYACTESDSPKVIADHQALIVSVVLDLTLLLSFRTPVVW